MKNLRWRSPATRTRLISLELASASSTFPRRRSVADYRPREIVLPKPCPPAPQRRLVRSRIVDMLENVALGNAATIHAAENTCIDDPSCRAKFSFAATGSTNSFDADARPTTTDPIERTAASRKLDIDGSTEERVYSDGFLKSCGELASYTDSIRDRKDCATTWSSRVRRRCFNVRGKCSAVANLLGIRCPLFFCDSVP